VPIPYAPPIGSMLLSMRAALARGRHRTCAVASAEPVGARSGTRGSERKGSSGRPPPVTPGSLSAGSSKVEGHLAGFHPAGKLMANFAHSGLNLRFWRRFSVITSMDCS
jgi:hypothetical protein